MKTCACAMTLSRRAASSLGGLEVVKILIGKDDPEVSGRRTAKSGKSEMSVL